LMPAWREAKRRRHHLVERAERVRVLLSVEALDLAAAAEIDAAGKPRAVAVERHDERLVKSALVVRICRVAQVVLDAFELVADTKLAKRRLELLLPPVVKFRRFPAPALRAALGDIA